MYSTVWEVGGPHTIVGGSWVLSLHLIIDIYQVDLSYHFTLLVPQEKWVHPSVFVCINYYYVYNYCVGCIHIVSIIYAINNANYEVIIILSTLSSVLTGV